MVVVEIMERKWGKWGIVKIEMRNNCVRLELGVSKFFQDKGRTKLQAFYSCYFEALEE